MVSSNDVARLFIQAVISRRVVSDKLARVLWAKSVEAVRAVNEDLDIPYDPARFDDFINELNTRLSPVDIKLCVTVDEVTGKKIWVVVNQKGDDLAQIATDYTAVEIAYFKAVVEQIVLASESYSISSTAALREVNNLKTSMSKMQAEVLLTNFVAKGWLLYRLGRFSLSSRALLELQTYLKTNYEDDIHECTFCFDLLTKGVGCYIPACAARLHDHCYARFARENTICPSCRTDWSQSDKLIIIGEGATRSKDDGRRKTKTKVNEEQETESQDSQSELELTKRADIAKAGKRRQRRVQDEVEDGSDSTDEMDVDKHQRPAQAKSQRARRKR